MFVKGEGNWLVDNVLFLSSYSVTSEGAVSDLVDHGEETIGHNLNGRVVNIKTALQLI